MSKPAPELTLTADHRAQLEAIAIAPGYSSRQVHRANIVLLAAAGLSNSAISTKTGAGRTTVLRCRSRIAESGIDGVLKDRPHTGRPPRISSAVKEAIIHDTLLVNSERGRVWSAYQMAWLHKVSESTVQHLWMANGLGDRASRNNAAYKARIKFISENPGVRVPWEVENQHSENTNSRE